MSMQASTTHDELAGPTDGLLTVPLAQYANLMARLIVVSYLLIIILLIPKEPLHALWQLELYPLVNRCIASCTPGTI